MPRAKATDPLQVYEFQVISAEGKFSGGFTSCTSPDVEVDKVSLASGTRSTRYYPGKKHFGNISMRNGVMRNSIDLWNWMSDTIEGRDCRDTIVVRHMARGGNKAALEYTYYECFPVTHKPYGDFDAMSSDISMREIEFAFESMDVKLMESNDPINPPIQVPTTPYLAGP